MLLTMKKLWLVLALCGLLLASCENPDSCDLQMVAGGSRICQEARGR